MTGTVSASLAPARVAALVEFCRNAPVQALIVAFSDGVTQGAVPALSRWAPRELDAYMRRLADAAVEAVRPDQPPPRWLVDMSERAPGLAGFLTAGTRDALAAACAGLSLPRRPHWVTGEAAAALAYYGRSPEEQVGVLADAFPVGLTRAARVVLAPLPPGAVLQAAGEKAAERPEVERLAYWLQHLTWSRGLQRLPLSDPVAPFLELTGHADTKVRALAMSLLRESRDCEAIAVAFAARGWRWAEDMDREEGAQGSLLLLEATPSLCGSVLERADPQVAVAAFDKDTQSIRRLTALLRREVKHILDRTTHSSGRLWCRENDLDGFVEREPDEAERLVRPAIGPSRDRSTFLFVGFPVMGLCQGLLRHRLDVGAALWRSLMNEQHDGITRRGDLALLPFRVVRSEVIDTLREHALSRARDDAAVVRIAGPPRSTRATAGSRRSSCATWMDRPPASPPARSCWPGTCTRPRGRGRSGRAASPRRPSQAGSRPCTPPRRRHSSATVMRCTGSMRILTPSTWLMSRRPMPCSHRGLTDVASSMGRPSCRRVARKCRHCSSCGGTSTSRMQTSGASDGTASRRSFVRQRADCQG